MKKIIITLVITFFVAISSFAQQGINYKALIKDDLGNVLADQTIGVQFQIREAAANGNVVYTETHTPTTDANGIIVLNIGTGTTTDTFSAIDWSSNEHWLDVQIDILGGSNYTDMSTTQFMAVPYALSAGNVDGLERVTDSIDSGTGLPIYGWRLKGRDPSVIGKIGRKAVDLSHATSELSMNTGATGEFSAALNLGVASGHSSIAMGEFTRAMGRASTAMGDRSEAIGDLSTAMGVSTVASGFASTAMGFEVTAPSYVETTIGRLNTAYVPNSAIDWDEADRLFTIGNGSYVDFETINSDALIVLKNGTITAPSFDISEITDDKALITKEYLDISNITKIDDLTDGKSDVYGSSLFIGKNAGLNDDGSFNRNVGIGSEALISNISGHTNVAYGVDALKDNSSGFENTAIGVAALKYNIDGKENTAIGGGALLNNKGDRNIAIGKYAGQYNNAGSDNIFIGFESGSPSAANNRLYINNGASINPLIYGEFDTNLVRINGTFDVTEEINREATGDANLVPIAYGTISSTGDILSGTGNFTVDTTNAPTLYINVTGANLSHSNSSASVTPLSGAFRTASITHSNGDLRVYIFNSSGTQVANTFQFIVYKL